MNYEKLKINKLPDPDMIEKHIQIPKASNGKYSLANASYSSLNNSITSYFYSLDQSFSDDPEYNNINKWLNSFDKDRLLSIRHELHHKHNNEAQIDGYNFSPLHYYQFALYDEMSATMINYAQDIANDKIPKKFKDFYLLFSTSFNIIENYVQYANQFYRSAFGIENHDNIVSLSKLDQKVLYNEIIDWYFTYDTGAFLNKQNKKWLNKFTKDTLYTFAVNETIETPENSDRITKIVTERRKKWLDAKIQIKQNLDKKLNEYKQQSLLQNMPQTQKYK